MEENRTIEQEVFDLRIKMLEVLQRLEKIEKSNTGTGVYLDGAPDYARKYYEDQKKLRQDGGKK